jgi:hypothetical protein
MWNAVGRLGDCGGLSRFCSPGFDYFRKDIFSHGFLGTGTERVRASAITITGSQRAVRLNTPITEELAMAKYFVQSGPLKVVVVADDSRDAALESVSWWGTRNGSRSEAAHRRDLAEDVWVSRSGFNRGGDRFTTFELLSRLNNQVPEQAWDQLMQRACREN